MTKSLSEKNRYDKKAFLLKNNDKFGYLVKNEIGFKFLNIKFGRLLAEIKRPKYQNDHFFMLFASITCFQG